MNILIVKLSAIGDVIHTLPALNAIRKRYPDAHITWLIEEAASSLIEGHTALNRVLVSKRKTWLKGLAGRSCLNHIREACSFIKHLRDTRYDLILDFQSLLKSGVLIGLARGGQKIGFDKGMDHQAVLVYKRAQEVEPDNPIPSIVLADFFKAKGQKNMEISSLKEAFIIDPYYPGLTRRLGELGLRVKMPEPKLIKPPPRIQYDLSEM